MTRVPGQLAAAIRDLLAAGSLVRTTSKEIAACQARLEKLASGDQDEVWDEKVWTWLVACGYAAAGSEGLEALTRGLTRGAESSRLGHAIWFEARPPSPRDEEGRTHLDLALGDLAPTPATEGGIAAAEPAEWICFCEMKWYSDLSGKVTNDQHRNQLARVIENALVLAPDGAIPCRTHVTLVTPAAFRGSRSRFYEYKFLEYESDRRALLLDLYECGMPARHPEGLLEARMELLRLHWVTFEELFAQLPRSEIQEPILRFRDAFDGS